MTVGRPAQYRCRACPASSAPRARPRAEEPVAAARREPLSSPPTASPGSTSTRPTTEVATELAERFGWHPLDVEDVLSKRQRPKVDEYPDYLFGVLHFPFYDKAVQRLNAAELDFFLGPDYLVTLPTVELLPGRAGSSSAASTTRSCARALLEGLRPPALRGARRPLRLLLPDPRQDRLQARLDRGRRARGPLRGGRARHLERRSRRSSPTARSSSRSARRCGCSSGASSASSPRSSSSTSTTSSTRPSASGTCSTTTRRSSRRSRRRTSR